MHLPGGQAALPGGRRRRQGLRGTRATAQVAGCCPDYPDEAVDGPSPPALNAMHEPRCTMPWAALSCIDGMPCLLGPGPRACSRVLSIPSALPTCLSRCCCRPAALAQGAVPIPGAKDLAQAKDNLGALGWRLRRAPGGGAVGAGQVGRTSTALFAVPTCEHSPPSRYHRTMSTPCAPLAARARCGR